MLILILMLWVTIMISRVEAVPGGFQLSEFIQGYWRLAEWNMSAQQRLDFLKQHLSWVLPRLTMRIFMVGLFS